jgi:HD-GYP domain-containing protein (c-di-GMP phosphodiesterase class II)/HAMP domain-containing protein
MNIPDIQMARRATLPLRVHVAVLLISALLLIGGVLAWLGYRSSTDVLTSASDQMLRQVAKSLDVSIRAAYGPAATTVDLLSRSRLTDARNFDERLKSLPLMVEGFAGSPQFETIYAGYADGDFFIVRQLRTADELEYYSAPADAAYMVTSREIDSTGEQTRVRMFFDADLVALERRRLDGSDFDARTRPWYLMAAEKGERVLTEPYLFHGLNVAGLTISRRFELGGGVVAADVTLGQLSQTLTGFEITPSSKLVLIDHQGRVIAHSDPQVGMSVSDESGEALMQANELDHTPLGAMTRFLEPGAESLEFTFADRRWTARLREFTTRADEPWTLVLLVPEDELLGEANLLLRRSTMITVILVVALIPIAWIMANLIARPLNQLVSETERIRRFDFQEDVHTDSRVREINDLATSMNTMKNTIDRFIAMIASLSREQAYSLLLNRVLAETMQVCGDRAGVIYLLNEDDSALEPASARLAEDVPSRILEPLPVALPPHPDDGELAAALAGKEVRLFHSSRTDQQPPGGDLLAPFFEAFNAAELSFTVVPLHDRKNLFMGALCLVDPVVDNRQSDANEQERLSFIVALSGFAAVSIESQRLLKMEKDLLDAFIRLIAGAIDAKSPYTGGHCQRVPALTKMLARAANDSDSTPYAEFQLNDEEWEALHIASWLHDCGKVTTPEYVVDKSTKLETIYDRVHEVRMRFEVLKRDAEVRCWRTIADGGDRESALRELSLELQTLNEEFNFVAECNQGVEDTVPQRVERLRAIAARTWQRTLDDRIGVSWEERKRKQRSPAAALPVTEKLLDDKPEHLVERDDSSESPDLADRGFHIEMPEYAYNRGELYNLSIERGTLSSEERFRINDHIVQTILMLEELPFPRHLRAVPGIAGGHHEKMDGTGYPKRLRRDDMPLTARMMAIADIFEALTASDRPYKSPKKLSEAIRIMSHMKKDNHIDPELFDLFLESGVYLAYAKEFLDPEQIDDVDITAYRSG